MDNRLVSALIFLNFLLPTAIAHAEVWTVADNFDNEDLNNVVWAQSHHGTAVSQGISGGRFRLYVNEPLTDQDRGGLGSKFRVVGDFDLQVDYHLDNWPSGNGVFTGVSAINQRFGDSASLSRQSTPYNGSVERQVFAGDLVGIAGSPTTMMEGTFRMLRVGQRYDAFVAALGSSDWQPVGAPIVSRDQYPMAVFLHAATDPFWFAGHPVAVSFDNFHINFTYNRVGDADFDNGVYFSDLLLLAQHYGQTTGATWPDGDFDHDGDVDFTDLLRLAQNFQSGFAQDYSALGSPAFQSDWQRAQMLTPEPASTALLLLVLRRRRRRTN